MRSEKRNCLQAAKILSSVFQEPVASILGKLVCAMAYFFLFVSIVRQVLQPRNTPQLPVAKDDLEILILLTLASCWIAGMHHLIWFMWQWGSNQEDKIQKIKCWPCAC